MNNEMAIIQENNFTTGMISSVAAETQEEKLAIYAAVSDAEPLADHVGEVIAIQDVIIQPVTVEDPTTGEDKQANRIVLITDKGDVFGCVSTGVETALKNLFVIVGRPTWEPALPMKIVEKKGRKGFKFVTLEYAPGGKAKK